MSAYTALSDDDCSDQGTAFDLGAESDEDEEWGQKDEGETKIERTTTTQRTKASAKPVLPDNDLSEQEVALKDFRFDPDYDEEWDAGASEEEDDESDLEETLQRRIRSVSKHKRASPGSFKKRSSQFQIDGSHITDYSARSAELYVESDCSEENDDDDWPEGDKEEDEESELVEPVKGSSSKRKRDNQSRKIDRGRLLSGKGGYSLSDMDDDDDDDDDDLPAPGKRMKKPKQGRTGRTVGKKYPPEIHRLLGEAQSHYVNRNTEGACKALAEVVRQCPSIPEPYTLLALVYVEKGEHNSALVFYKLACVRDKKNVALHQSAIKEAMIVKDYQAAYNLLKAVVRVDPGNVESAIHRAQCLVSLNRPKQAIEQYRRLSKRFPRRLDIYLDLAEQVSCTTPTQNLNVQQALAACLGNAIGGRYLRPDVAALAAGWSVVPQSSKKSGRTKGQRPVDIFRGARDAAVALVSSLMEQKKMYDLAAQVVVSLFAWIVDMRLQVVQKERSTLGHGNGDMGSKGQGDDGEGGVGEGKGLDESAGQQLWLGGGERSGVTGEENDEDAEEEEDEEEEDEEEDGLEKDLDSEDSGSDGVGDYDVGGFAFDGEEPGGEESDDEEDGGRMGGAWGGVMTAKMYYLPAVLVVNYAICQLWLNKKEEADKNLAFLHSADAQDLDKGDLMLKAAEAYQATKHPTEADTFLHKVAASLHPRRRFAMLSLGAAHLERKEYEKAAGHYKTVLLERPGHEAALVGYAESSYWQGGEAVVKAAECFTGAVRAMLERARARAKSKTGAGSGTIATNPGASAGTGRQGRAEDEEGEHGDEFQRLQILVQWAMLSCIAGGVGKGERYVCVALPLLSHALAQIKQCLMTSVATSTRLTGQHQQQQKGAGPKVQTDVSSQDVPATLLPVAVPLIVDVESLQLGDLESRALAMTEGLCGLPNMDIRARMGRQSLYHHACLVVETLLETEKPAAAKAVVDAVLGQGRFLKGVEKERLQAVADGKQNISSTFPSGASVDRNVAEESSSAGPMTVGTAVTGVQQPPPKIQTLVQWLPPPWRLVESGEVGFDPLIGGREWYLNGSSTGGLGKSGRWRGPDGFTRKSRSQALLDMYNLEGDPDAVCAIVQALTKAPNQNSLWNLMHRVLLVRGEEPGDYTDKVEALVTRLRERTPALLHKAHDNAMWSRPRHALRLYAQGHASRPEEPLPLLCLAAQTLRIMSLTEISIDDPKRCLMQAFACLHRYVDLRKAQGSMWEAEGKVANDEVEADSETVVNITWAALEQECFYNMGRGYHQVGITHMAIEYYQRALQIEDERGSELRMDGGREGVTRDAAYNLCLLYRSHGAVALARQTMLKYLSVG